MNEEQIKQYLNYIKTFDIKSENDINSVIKIIEEISIDYDNKSKEFQKINDGLNNIDENNKSYYKETAKNLFNLMRLESEILFTFTHKYAKFKLNIKLCDIRIINDKNSAIAYYQPYDGNIYYNLNNLITTSMEIIGTVFHEMRHVKQHYYRHSNFNIDFEPLTLLMSKELILRNDKVNYNNNHNNFISENDANLFGKKILKDFYSKYLKKAYNIKSFDNSFPGNEQNSFCNIYDSEELLDDEKDQIYNEEDQNNRIILFNRYVSERIKKEPTILNKYPILSYIYNHDGTEKNYEQLINERNELISKNQEIMIKTINSETKYEENVISAEYHIKNIYKIIICSDPKLWLEHSLKNKRYKRVKDMIKSNEIVAKEFVTEFMEILNKYNDNVEVQNIINLFNDTYLNSNKGISDLSVKKS